MRIERTLIAPSLPARWKQVLLLEDNSARHHRKMSIGVRALSGKEVVVRFHRIRSGSISVVGENAYSPGTLGDLVGVGGRAKLALNLLDSLRAYRRETLIVAGPQYGGNRWFIDGLRQRGFDWTVELPRNAVMVTEGCSEGKIAADLVSSAKKWKTFDIASPTTGNLINYAVAHLGYVRLGGGGARFV